MPLKIETGTYTVNPVIKKEGSKFSLWKHWRRSVQEDRGLEDFQRRRGPVHGEVAGLEEAGNGNLTVALVADSGGTGRAQRRTRPLSLAVQPLNYHQVDPDIISSKKHPNMTSQESIGSCSLDVDQSASDRSEKTVGSLSEKTLHSFNLSYNGEETSSPENLRNGSSETLQHASSNGNKCPSVNNGHHYIEVDQLTAKKPSYLGLACSINGYSGITRYDSKLREGFRSRDSSPGPRLITREASPVGYRSNENLNIPSHQKSCPSKSQSISPLAMDHQNGFTNGTKDKCKIEKFIDSKRSINVCQGFSEVDKGVSLNSTFSEISPIRNNATTKRTHGSVHVASYNQQNISYSSTISSSSPKSAAVNLSNSSFSDTSLHNGSSLEVDNHVLNSSSSSEKSFIQQRVERLYGPGALAQGFFFKRSSFNKSSASDSSFNKSNNDNNTSIDSSNTEESLKNWPVLRLLRPEFRAQLPVVNTRKPTDGSEQIIKPLQRLSVAKNEAKEKSPVPEDVEKKELKNNSLQLSSSTTSITDQQPAAPQVVLPVLESSTSNSKQEEEVIEVEKAVVEKNGHYFMKLLKEERDRLLLLAESVEKELSIVDPSVLPEEAAGKLRSASGKARLLASQKMQQFEGLCHKNINKVEGEEFPTKNEDLEGFWDMLMLQVIQVHELFEQIERSRKSQWQEVCPDNFNPKPSSKCRSFKKSKIFKPPKGITYPKLLKTSKEYSNDSQNQLDLAVGLNEKFNQEITENFESKLQSNKFPDSKQKIRPSYSRTFENFDECLNESNLNKFSETKLNNSNFLRLTPETPNFFYAESSKPDIFDESFDENEVNCAEARSVLSEIENNFNLKMHRTKKRENIRNQRLHIVTGSKKQSFIFPDKKKSFSADFNDQIHDSVNSRKCLSSNRFNSLESLNTENLSQTINKVSRSRARSFSPEEKSIGDSISEGQKSYSSDKSFHAKPSLRSRSLESRRKSKLNVTFADETVFDVISYEENYLTEDDEKESTDSSILEDSENHNYLCLEKDDSLIKNNDLSRTQSVFRLQNIDFQSPILEVPENENDVNFQSKLESHFTVSEISQSKGTAFTIPMIDKVENCSKTGIKKLGSNEGCIKKSKLGRSFQKTIQEEEKPKDLSLKSYEHSKLDGKNETEDSQNDKKKNKISSFDIKKSRISRLRPPSSYGKKGNPTDGINYLNNNSKTVEDNSMRGLNKPEEFSSLNVGNEKKSSKSKDHSSDLNKKLEKQDSRPTSVSSRKSQESGVPFAKRTSKSIEKGRDAKDDNKIVRKPVNALRVAPVLPKQQINSLKSLNSNDTVIIKSLKSTETNCVENFENKKDENTDSSIRSKKPVFNSQRNKIMESTIDNKSNSRSESLDRKKNSLKKRMTESLSKFKPKPFAEKREGSFTKKGKEKNVSSQNNNSIVTNIWRNISTPCKEGQIKNKAISKSDSKQSRVWSKSASQSILQTPNISNFPRYSKEAQRLLFRKYTKPLSLSNASKLEKLKKYNTKKGENLINKDMKITPDLKFMNQGEPNHHQEIVKVEKCGNQNFMECFKSVLNANIAESNIRDLEIGNEVNSKNFHSIVSNVIPLKNSKFQEIKINQSRSRNSISLASFCESETSMTRVVLETSRIIQSNSKVEEHFYANVLKRSNEESSLLQFDRYQPSKRKNTMFAIRRDENYGYLKLPPNEIKSGIESESFNSTINIVPEKRSVPGTPLNGSTPKRRTTPAPKMKATPASEANKKAREAREQSRRQMIEERRRAMKSMSKKDNNSVEIFIPET